MTDLFIDVTVMGHEMPPGDPDDDGGLESFAGSHDLLSANLPVGHTRHLVLTRGTPLGRFLARALPT
jgi:hypothetical protein